MSNVIFRAVASDILMGRKIFVFTNIEGKIIGSFTPGKEQPTDPLLPQIATDVEIPGQTIHEMEIPGHLPEDVSTDVLHQELAKALQGKK